MYDDKRFNCDVIMIKSDVNYVDNKSNSIVTVDAQYISIKFYLLHCTAIKPAGILSAIDAEYIVALVFNKLWAAILFVTDSNRLKANNLSITHNGSYIFG